MHYRRFANTRVDVSEIGLGCWQLGGRDWGDVSDEEAFEILRASVEGGVTFLDTADVYGPAQSEQLIGRFLKAERPKKLFVATKLGRYPWPEFSLDSFRVFTEASLVRLRVEALDLTQLHCIPTERLMSGEPFEWLEVLKNEGKLKHYGASVESVDEALWCIRHAPGCSSLQVIFNIFRQKPLTTLFREAKHHGVALIVRLPLASGLLSGKVRRDTTFPADDHRNYNRDGQAFNVGETFAGLTQDKGAELAEDLKAFVPPGMTMAQMALRWILDHDAVTTVIPGASTPDQARANAAASDLPELHDDLHERLRRFYLDRVAAHIRGPY